jgi:hypothetical protein
MTQWTELSDSERIEELRRDVLKTMGAVNQLSAHSELVIVQSLNLFGELIVWNPRPQNWNLRGR